MPAEATTARTVSWTDSAADSSLDVQRTVVSTARRTPRSVSLIDVSARVDIQILGDSQIGLTLRLSSHVVPELADDAADKIAQTYWR